MKYHEMTKNYIFREFKCKLTEKEAAKLCFKSVRTVKEWDKGKTIPPECKRLMRLATKNKLSTLDEWYGFKIVNNLLELPTGQKVTPQQILTGIALVEIESTEDIKTKAKLLKYARAIAKLKA
ncbi:regulator [Vibrio cincinnatiensis]|uniref:regulator n=1 Tax=Vibrio cincinnatiensis TaxID=675 RepID=UPI001EE0735A|nr:regulator [Vibrio cincinnatiensis]MCG3721388.1 regulator [Vibrio cincinnatiensis]